MIDNSAARLPEEHIFRGTRPAVSLQKQPDCSTLSWLEHDNAHKCFLMGIKLPNVGSKERPSRSNRATEKKSDPYWSVKQAECVRGPQWMSDAADR